jgi:hypothetical protein
MLTSQPWKTSRKRKNSCQRRPPPPPLSPPSPSSFVRSGPQKRRCWRGGRAASKFSQPRNRRRRRSRERRKKRRPGPATAAVSITFFSRFLRNLIFPLFPAPLGSRHSPVAPFSSHRSRRRRRPRRTMTETESRASSRGHKEDSSSFQYKKREKKEEKRGIEKRSHWKKRETFKGGRGRGGGRGDKFLFECLQPPQPVRAADGGGIKGDGGGGPISKYTLA